MDYITLKARAKVNLTLDVTGKRPDGYHDLKMVMQTVALYDGVYIKKIEKEIIKSKSNLEWLPTDDKNLATRGAKLLMDKFNLPGGIFIELDKRIPVAAGLGGGSADCAAVLVGMNRLFHLGLSRKKLMELGLSLGADIPYCIMRGTALAEGIGEKLKKISPCPAGFFVLVKPSFGISTAMVYQNLNLNNLKTHPDTERMMDAIRRKDMIGVGRRLGNVLETVVVPMHPVVDEIKKRLIELGALGALMSGSGPTVFGIFQERSLAEQVAEQIREDFGIREVFVTIPYGFKKGRNEGNYGRI